MIEHDGAQRGPDDSRLEEISDALFRVASLDFGRPLEPRGDGSVTDAVIGCINMLSEELRAHLDERQRIEEDLEARVRTRTAELEASMERYRMLVETTHVVPWELEGSTLVVSYIAPRAESLLGRPPESFVGNTSFWDCIRPEDREAVSNAITALATTASGHIELEYRLVDATGNPVDAPCILGRDDPTIVGAWRCGLLCTSLALLACGGSPPPVGSASGGGPDTTDAMAAPEGGLGEVDPTTIPGWDMANWSCPSMTGADSCLKAASPARMT